MHRPSSLAARIFRSFERFFPCALLSCLGATLAVAGPARAAPGGLPRVLILPAEASAASAAVTNVQGNLMASGRFSQVDIFIAATATPTLAELLAYDAVLTWSNINYFNSTALGNVMADYVDAGGGVVVAPFANANTSILKTMQGRWPTGGYAVIAQQSGYTTGSASLGVVVDPTHPLTAGVSTFSGGTSSWRPTTLNMTPGAYVIATWSDGRLLVALHGWMPARVDLGFHPPSAPAVNGSWIASTDGALLLSNALAYVADASTIPEPFCFGDGSGTPCPCGNAGLAGRGCASSVAVDGARIATGGISRISADSLVLSGSGMPNGPALYLQGLSQSGGGTGFQLGDGLRCAGNPIVRLKHVMNVAGASQLPQAGDPDISVMGFVTTPGTRTYQVWYRDAAPFCTPSTYNLTNGVQVTWIN